MPTVTSGAAARSHLLDTYGTRDPGSRGSGVVSARHGERRDGTLDVRWATLGESTVVIGYAGPVRALDAAMFGDSVYVALRPSDLGFGGLVTEKEGLGADGLRFLARPWDLGAPWVRDAIAGAVVDPHEGGWRMTGRFGSPTGAHPFDLELDRHGDPTRLVVGRRGSKERLTLVRYGPPKSYRGGRMPRWIEWEQGTAIVRLSIDEYARGAPARFTHPPAPDPEWTMMGLDDPRTRDLLRRYLGVGGREEDR